MTPSEGAGRQRDVSHVAPGSGPDYGCPVLLLSVGLGIEQVLRECERRGLVIRSETGLASCRGGRHWHLHIPGLTGTLELNECRGEVEVKVHPLRDGGWASAFAAELHAMPVGGLHGGAES